MPLFCNALAPNFNQGTAPLAQAAATARGSRRKAGGVDGGQAEDETSRQDDIGWLEDTCGEFV